MPESAFELSDLMDLSVGAVLNKLYVHILDLYVEFLYDQDLARFVALVESSVNKVVLCAHIWQTPECIMVTCLIQYISVLDIFKDNISENQLQIWAKGLIALAEKLLSCIPLEP